MSSRRWRDWASTPQIISDSLIPQVPKVPKAGPGGTFGTFGTPLLRESPIIRGQDGQGSGETSAPAAERKPLADLDPEAPGVPYTQWKAAELNRIFAEHGGGPGRITAATVEDGLAKRAAGASHE